MKEKKKAKKDSKSAHSKSKKKLASNQKIEIDFLHQLNKTIVKPEIKTTGMEAYHPHGNHQNRKFKDYIFEFIMIFIAISGGFFMENIRESYIEHHREKEYIGSLIKDIEYDTTNLQYVLKNNRRQIKGIDSLISLLDIPIQKMNLPKLFLYTFTYLNNFDEFTPHDITIIQLKNSGGLRLIRNKSVLDNIVLYYSEIDRFRETNEKVYKQLVDDNFKLEMMFMDFSAIETNKCELYNTTKIMEFRNRIYMFKDAIKWDSYVIKDFYNQGVLLLINIKKDYKIKS